MIRRTASRQRVVIVAIAAIVAAVVAGYCYLRYFGPDYDDSRAQGRVVVQIREGDSQKEIGMELERHRVVASATAFVISGFGDGSGASLQPGYYFIQTQISAAEAIKQISDPKNRVGHLVFEGKALHDQVDLHSGSVNKGLYSMISEASCVGGDCVPKEELEQSGAYAELDALGVPSWAHQRVNAVEDRTRRLEGLIASGDFNFNPRQNATAILHEIINDSVTRYRDTGLSTSNSVLSAYDQVVAASLVERESRPEDFTKVARVILNRLKKGQRLEFDSTVNYALDGTAVATTDADRARETPWNTYAKTGLPATPIVSPSLKALAAVENPADGNWLYFVTVDDKGTTKFTADYQEHLRNQTEALDSGFLRGGS